MQNAILAAVLLLAFALLFVNHAQACDRSIQQSGLYGN